MSEKINLNSIPTIPSDKIDKSSIEKENESLLERLSEIQNKLFAQKKFAVLIILQGMDASGKDGAVKNVFSGVNPAGCMVKSFKAPSEEEQSHHFLWRINKYCPEKGMIQIFNRSHYEDILVPMVNNSMTDKDMKFRCEEINAFEKGLMHDQTIILKYYLHVSHEEQLKRLEDRKTDLQKRWKYQKEDIAAIAQHNDYKKVYESIFENCSESVPWKLIPADKKWYKNYAILKSIVEELEAYPIDYPVLKL